MEELPRTLQYLLDQILANRTSAVVDLDRIDNVDDIGDIGDIIGDIGDIPDLGDVAIDQDTDSSDTVIMCDNAELDQQYRDLMTALERYIDLILIEEIGGNRLPTPNTESWCLVPGYPDTASLVYYSIVVTFLSTLMQTVKGERPLNRSAFSAREIDRAYYSLQQLGVSDSVVQLYNDCLNSMLTCIPQSLVYI